MDLKYRTQRLKTECTYAVVNVNISAVRNTTVYDDTVGEGVKTGRFHNIQDGE
jgi:hypothetical protein